MNFTRAPVLSEPVKIEGWRPARRSRRRRNASFHEVVSNQLEIREARRNESRRRQIYPEGARKALGLQIQGLRQGPQDVDTGTLLSGGE